MKNLISILALSLLAASCSTGGGGSTLTPPVTDSSYITAHYLGSYDSSTTGITGSVTTNTTNTMYFITSSSTKLLIQLSGSKYRDLNPIGVYYYPLDAGFGGGENTGSFYDRILSKNYVTESDSNQVTITRTTGYIEGSYNLYVIDGTVRTSFTGSFKIKK